MQDFDSRFSSELAKVEWGLVNPHLERARSMARGDAFRLEQLAEAETICADRKSRKIQIDREELPARGLVTAPHVASIAGVGPCTGLMFFAHTESKALGAHYFTGDTTFRDELIQEAQVAFQDREGVVVTGVGIVLDDLDEAVAERQELENSLRRGGFHQLNLQFRDEGVWGISVDLAIGRQVILEY